MSVYTRRTVACDRCHAEVLGHEATGPSEGAKEIRRRARTAGWTHPSGYVDLCPCCSRDRCPHQGGEA